LQKIFGETTFKNKGVVFQESPKSVLIPEKHSGPQLFLRNRAKVGVRCESGGIVLDSRTLNVLNSTNRRWDSPPGAGPKAQGPRPKAQGPRPSRGAAGPKAWEPGSLGAWEPGSLGAWEPGSLGAWEPGGRAQGAGLGSPGARIIAHCPGPGAHGAGLAVIGKTYKGLLIDEGD
jgi:hypothetical protein